MSPIETKFLQSVLQSTVEGGKYVTGAREVTNSVKSSRLVVYASNAPAPLLERVRKACKASAVPAVAFEGSSLELGRICKKRYRVVAIGIRSPGTTDITPLLRTSKEEPHDEGLVTLRSSSKPLFSVDLGA